MGRPKAIENTLDPATGRPLPLGVACRGASQYRARKLVDGTRVTRTFDTSRLAREWLEETSVRVREGAFVDRRSLDQTTLAELVQRFVTAEMQDGGRRRGAAEDRGHVPAIMTDTIGSLPLSRLTPTAIRSFRDRQGKAYAASTVVKRLNLLARILNHAIGEWDVPLAVNPASSALVKRPDGADIKRERRLEAPRQQELRDAAARGEEKPEGEEERLLKGVAASPCADDVLVTRLALAQAMRMGEIIALRWVDIDFEKKLLTVRGRHERGTKTGGHLKTARRKEERGWEIRPLMPEAAATLIEKLGDRKPDAEALVFSVGGPNAFKVRIGRIIAKAGLQDLRFHDLRHVATSKLAKRYPNPLDLKRVTGHQDVKSLDRYYQPDLTELAEAGGLS